MNESPQITFHMLPPSHPCMTVEAALRLKGLDFQREILTMGSHNEEVAAIYGEGAKTVPGIVIDGEPVHGSVAILERLEQIVPSPPLYPEGKADAVREAERWGDGLLQDLGRRLPWAALYFRPEAMGTFGGGEALDPAGTDFAIQFVRRSWKYHKITAQQIASDLEAFPGLMKQIDQYAADGLIDGDEPTAADLQIAASVRVISTVGDMRPLIEAGAAGRIAKRWFSDYPGDVPAGAFPAGWVPQA